MKRRATEITEKYQAMINSFKEGKKDLSDMDKMMLGAFESDRDAKLAILKSNPVMPKKSLEGLQEEARDMLSEQSKQLQGVTKHIKILCDLNGADSAFASQTEKDTLPEFNAGDYKEQHVFGSAVPNVLANKITFAHQYSKLLSIRGP